MKLLSFLAVWLFASPVVLGDQCYDCKTVVKQLQAKGKNAVAACYNPKFPRKKQPQCTATATSWTTVTKKLTSTKTAWKTLQSTNTVTKTGPPILKTKTVTSTETVTSTVTLLSTNIETTSTATTSLDSYTITERSPTVTIPFVVQTVVTTEYTATVPASTSISIIIDDLKKRDNNFDYKCSSAACYCLLGLQPKTSTVKIKKTKTKTIVVRTTTITKTSTTKPATKYISIAGTTTATEVDLTTKTDIATKVDLKTLTEVSTITEYSTEYFTKYIPTTIIQETTTTTTTQDVLTSGAAIATEVCQTNVDFRSCGARIPFRRACSLKISSDASTNFDTIGICVREMSFDMPGYAACSAAFTCGSQVDISRPTYASYFLTKLRTGGWRCTLQHGYSAGVDEAEYVEDPEGLEVFFFNWSAA
ncbi:hypothetical protein TWF481_006073 [Arthrobotrys musiformis]|uniref:Uncharacterized protein n=1 Tax=Arthrobotrys musiformis TaxID=47236 RepID=A0AAV9WHL6_9PEZI